jgi:hypothetical protein
MKHSLIIAVLVFVSINLLTPVHVLSASQSESQDLVKSASRAQADGVAARGWRFRLATEVEKSKPFRVERFRKFYLKTLDIVSAIWYVVIASEAKQNLPTVVRQKISRCYSFD